MAKTSIPGLLLLFLPTMVAWSAEPIDFNQEIRPIFSNTCFRCHGPDEAQRKAELRLDSSDGATSDLGGYAAIVPGKPEASLLLERVRAHDPEEVMPPPKAGSRLSPSEIDLIEEWIKQGAPYARHWAYVKPAAINPPAVRDSKLVQKELDRFILRRLEKEELTLSPEANRHALARRVALDLTGLPPTWEEVERFVNSDKADAYAEYIDGLLEKNTFGEHWARHWLDLARYADSTGYADDPPRTIWAYRDYVIRSFNENKPFDVFTREQLAGDLLPKPTQEQLTATAFHRNTQTNNEGGTNDEEYRNVAIVDRVNTTFAVWMGTTMACAQCHTHKYDPITQREYFETFAIFNNSEDADRRDESPVLEVSTPEFKRKRAAKQEELKRLETAFLKPNQEVQGSFDKWQDEVASDSINWQVLKADKLATKTDRNLSANDDGWIEASASKSSEDVYTITAQADGPEEISALRLEILPKSRNAVLSEITLAASGEAAQAIRGQYVRINLKGRGKMIHIAEVQAFSGGKNIAQQGKASQSSTYADAVASRAIDGETDGDYNKGSVSHTAVGKRNPWWEVDLGEMQTLDRLVIWNRSDGSIGARLDGFTLTVLDTKRQPVWTQRYAKAPERDLVVALDGSRALMLTDASASFSQQKFGVEKAIDGNLEKGSGWAIAPHIDRPHSAVFQLAKPIKASELTLTLHQHYQDHLLQKFRVSVTSAPQPVREIPTAIRSLLDKSKATRSEAERKRLFEHFAALDPSLQKQREALAALRKEVAEMKPPTTVPIMRELKGDKRRKTRIQERGNYLSKTDLVTAGLPTRLYPSDGKAPDRLALANWLVASDNPLTARVTANRFWGAIFGRGLVRTSEEFGSQGEPPSHPELLDWLANELVASGWDVKSFLKGLVMSATYRQTSKLTPGLLERDPDNQLLARGPRFRLSAEMVRDQALFVSGLLSRKMFGAPVKPRQPNIGLSAAFGGGIDWTTSDGEDQYRRGIYTTWRRSNPYPSMAAFDAPNREVCIVRRDRTNTPLQALVTLNDPVYMEAAQALARQLIARGGTPEEIVMAAYQQCLLRPAKDAELRALTKLYRQTVERLNDEPKRAMELATDPLGPAPKGTNLTALAAWSVVGNVILNLDEIFLKP